ncbi:MAG: aminotransferase class I/II-fold pyridoxal phosphate-dependent enzyme [Oscillospiraceae bacterium]|nr:aminotransferase class I/II-fold pyridoxal phosphate-dependent enzyme [Oscillospiraceae bacterium]
MNFADRMNSISSSIFTVLDEKKKERLSKGLPVVNFSIGKPDFTPAPHVMEALSKSALITDNYKYAISDLPELIEAVIGWYKRRYNVTLEKDEIMSVYGSQEGIAHIGFPIVNPGDVVLVQNPSYPIFSFGPMLAGAVLYDMPLLPENDYLIDFDKIDEDVARKAKMMIVSYPNNPTTAVADRDFYERLVAFAKKYDIIVIHDNAYSELVYGDKLGMSFLEIEGAKDVGIEFNSLSKTYNITGARLSFAIGNRAIIEKFKALRSQIDYGIFLPVQHAGIAALNGPQDAVSKNRECYAKRGVALASALTEIGWKCEPPKGTMFMWAAIPENFTNSNEFVIKLLDETGVICVPGSSFGTLGEGFVRFALVANEEIIKSAAQSIKQSGILNK